MNEFMCLCFLTSTDQISEDSGAETHLFCEVDVIPVVFIELVPICQQSVDIVSCVTISLEVSVGDPRLFFPQLEKKVQTLSFFFFPFSPFGTLLIALSDKAI